jgi:hypothetical protein
MPFSKSNDQLTGRKPVLSPAGCEVVAERFELDLATGDLALSTIGSIGILPAGCLPVDVQVDGDDLDSGAAAMVLQVGIWDGAGANLSVAAADGGAHWGVTTAVNAAFLQRLTPNGNALARVQKSGSDRFLGVRVGTAPTTPVAGKLGVTLFYRAA